MHSFVDESVMKPALPQLAIALNKELFKGTLKEEYWIFMEIMIFFNIYDFLKMVESAVGEYFHIITAVFWD